MSKFEEQAELVLKHAPHNRITSIESLSKIIENSYNAGYSARGKVDLEIARNATPHHIECGFKIAALIEKEN